MESNVSWEQFQQALSNASSEIREKINSGIIGVTVDDAISEGKISNANRYEIVRLITNYTLGIVDNQELNELAADSGVSSSVLQELLQKITDTPAQSNASQENLSTDIAETEAALESLTGLRTMAGDMKAVQQPEEPVYTSTQTALINEAAPPPQSSNSPQNAPEAPRNIPVKSAAIPAAPTAAQPVPPATPRAIPPRQASTPNNSPRWESDTTT